MTQKHRSYHRFLFDLFCAKIGQTKEMNSNASERLTFKIPPGLCSLLKEMSNEYLRCKPENIREFFADYFEIKDFMKREKNIWIGKDFTVSPLSPQFVSSIYAILEAADITKRWKYFCVNALMKEFEKIERVFLKKDFILERLLNSSTMPSIFHEENVVKHMAEQCDFSSDETLRLRDACRCSFKMFYDEIISKNYKRASLLTNCDYDMIQDIMNKISSFSYRFNDTNISAEQMFPMVNQVNLAAVKIQSAFRGFKARKYVVELKEKRFFDVRLTERQKAAICIQSAYRKHLSTKQFEKVKSCLSTCEADSVQLNKREHMRV